MSHVYPIEIIVQKSILIINFTADHHRKKNISWSSREAEKGLKEMQTKSAKLSAFQLESFDVEEINKKRIYVTHTDIHAQPCVLRSGCPQDSRLGYRSMANEILNNVTLKTFSNRGIQCFRKSEE
ncbi:hypothetical protein LOAG_03855 [Loa loa]|uniref:Uncharacterized protein n=1 Tax=Loa loa TaxID=7209 RepID=A0A1S0U3R1_LOALO|nr:hypothetical protein LOAG_03855 [Loa loa]EFO24627.2 hypothetical protein LOAG_03855 [Loa loa]